MCGNLVLGRACGVWPTRGSGWFFHVHPFELGSGITVFGSAGQGGQLLSIAAKGPPSGNSNTVGSTRERARVSRMRLQSQQKPALTLKLQKWLVKEKERSTDVVCYYVEAIATRNEERKGRKV